MATNPLPEQAICCQCKQAFTVKAVMKLTSGSIPMLVVVQDVTSIEEALACATCQVCINKEGPKDRGLHGVLLALGCTQTPSLPAALSVSPRLRSEPPTLDVAALTKARGKHQVPTMAGVRVVMPPPLPRGNLHRAPPREERLNDRPRLPKVLEQPVVREPEPTHEPLRVSLDERSIAALKLAGADARKRDEEKKRVRLAKFGSLMEVLQASLSVIKNDPGKEDIGSHLDTFENTLVEALTFDPLQRGKKALLEFLSTSQDELDECDRAFWVTHTVVPGGGGEVRPAGHARLTPEVEEIEVNPFEGGVVPRRFNAKGEWPPISILPVIVVRTKPKLPTPNSPLGEPGSSPPRIVYTEGGRYGKEYTVEGSSRSVPKDYQWSWAQMNVAVWSLSHQDAVLICNGVTVNLSDLMCLYMEPYVLPDSEESSQEVPAEPADATAEGQPHAEV